MVRARGLVLIHSDTFIGSPARDDLGLMTPRWPRGNQLALRNRGPSRPGSFLLATGGNPNTRERRGRVTLPPKLKVIGS